MTVDKGQILLYDSGDGQEQIDVRLADETVWLSQAQMVDLFMRDQSVISRHLNNVFKEGELVKESNMQKMHIAHSDKPVAFYNLDVIISVGYRVKSKQGTQFRIWATRVLKEHLVNGFTYNEKRLAEKGLSEAKEVLQLLADTLNTQNLVSEEGQAVLDVVRRYANTWSLLLQYDEDTLKFPAVSGKKGIALEIEAARRAIRSLKQELARRKEATELFGNERNDHLEGIIGAVHQTFGGQDLYPNVLEKAAHLLYFVVKDHPFTDGNKRIGSFLLLLFLEQNGVLKTISLDNNALVALTLLVAASNPSQKDLLVRLIVNLLQESRSNGELPLSGR